MALATPSTNDVPVDVVLEIMVRLPVKSLIRFRLISKSFFSITASPNFINSHLARSRSSGYAALTSGFLSPPSSIAILDKSFAEIHRPEIPFSFSSQSELEFGGYSIYSLAGSCNGLLCITVNQMDRFGRDVVLWNPMVQKFKKVSDNTSLNSDMLQDIRTSITLWLGFDCRNNDHKIVRIVRSKYENEPSLQAEIYSLKTHSWRKVIFPTGYLSKILAIEDYKCSFDNGALHWIGCVSGETNSGNDTVIISFNIDDEQFKATKLPEDYARGAEEYTIDLIALRSSFVVAIVHETMEDGVMEEMCRVWRMKRDEETEAWTEQLLPITGVTFCYGSTEDGDLILSQDGLVVSFCNLESRTLKVSSLEDVESFVPFRESLVLL